MEAVMEAVAPSVRLLLLPVTLTDSGQCVVSV